MCTDVEQIEVKSKTGSPQPTAAEGDVHAPVEGVEGVQNPEEAVPHALDTSEVSFRPHPDAATYENVERITKESRVELDSEIDVVEGTRCGPTRPGAIVYSVPPQLTQQVPLSIIANTGFPETQEESQSQSILQFSTDGHTEVVVGPVVSTEVEINTGDPVEAGHAMEEPPLEVISEARVEKNGKTFFVLETQIARQTIRRNRGITCFVWSTRHKICPSNPRPRKKLRKDVRRKSDRYRVEIHFIVYIKTLDSALCQKPDWFL